MEFLCKSCGKREGEPQGWLLAVELIKPGSDLRNTIIYLDEWDARIATGDNALHFCSRECREYYLAQWHEELEPTIP